MVPMVPMVPIVPMVALTQACAGAVWLVGEEVGENRISRSRIDEYVRAERAVGQGNLRRARWLSCALQALDTALI